MRFSQLAKVSSPIETIPAGRVTAFSLVEPNTLSPSVTSLLFSPKVMLESEVRLNAQSPSDATRAGRSTEVRAVLANAILPITSSSVPPFRNSTVSSAPQELNAEVSISVSDAGRDTEVSILLPVKALSRRMTTPSGTV